MDDAMLLNAFLDRTIDNRSFAHRDHVRVAYRLPGTRAQLATLFAVFAVAAVISVVNAEWPLRFFYYAATAFLIERSVPSRQPA